jgi:type I restriction enzyme S subunit
MIKYDNYKGTGINWIPLLPQHWEIKKIGSLFTERREKVSDKEYAPLSVSKNGITPQLETAVKTDNGDNRKLVIAGDFVVNSRSDRKGSCGISPLTGSVSLINIVLKPKGSIIPNYFHYLSRSNEYIEEYYRLGRGIVADLWTTRYSELKNLQIPYPPQIEQERIARFIESKTLNIDTYVAERERELQLLNELKESEIANVITRGLDPNVKMKESQNGFIGAIPAHWQERKIKYCFTERSEKNHPDEPVLCSTQSQGVIPQSMYQNRVVVVNKGFEGLKFVKVGDFVISLRSFEGGIEYAYYQGIISAAYTVLTPIEDSHADYFKLLFKSQPFIQLLQTCVTGIREGQNINYEMLGRKFIPIPPYEEQKAIVAYIADKSTKINALIHELKSEIEYLKEYKQKLIADCVTGQIKVD